MKKNLKHLFTTEEIVYLTEVLKDIFVRGVTDNGIIPRSGYWSATKIEIKTLRGILEAAPVGNNWTVANKARLRAMILAAKQYPPMQLAYKRLPLAEYAVWKISASKSKESKTTE